MLNIPIELIIAVGYFFFWGICYRLGEIPVIWGKSNTHPLRFKWMQNSKWWTSHSPSGSFLREFFATPIFDDAYHFFHQLYRIVGSVVAGIYYAWYVGSIFGGFVTAIFCFVAYFVAVNLTLETITKPKKGTIS